jgi:hypothetical protein
LPSGRQTHVTVINTGYGASLTIDGYGFLRDAITGAGLLLDCKPPGFRETLGPLMLCHA